LEIFFISTTKGGGVATQRMVDDAEEGRASNWASFFFFLEDFQMKWLPVNILHRLENCGGSINITKEPFLSTF